MRAMKSDGAGRALAQREERALGVGVREHAPRRDLLAARQPHAHGPPPARHHLLDLGVAADLASCLARRVGHRRGEYAHAAAHEPPLTHAALGLLARVVVQQHVAGAGRRRPGHAVVDGVPAEGRLHVVTLEPLRQELVRARREQVRQVGEALALPQADASPLRQRAQVRERAHARIGRRPVERREGRPARARRGSPRSRAGHAHRRTRTVVASTLAAMSSPRE